MKPNRWLFVIMIFILALTTACGSSETPAPKNIPPVEEVAPPTDAPPVEEVLPSTDAPAPAATEIEFPLPDDVNAGSVTDVGDDAINFQTSLSLPDAINFYFLSFIDLDYKERRMLTVITETRFSIVFDGHPSGKAIVIQGTAFDGGVKIDLRLEDI